MLFNNWLWIIIILFLGINIFSAIKMRNATALLSDQQKAQLFKIFGSMRIYTLLLLSFIIIAYLYLIERNQKMEQTISIVYFLALFICLLGILLLSARKLRQHNYPADYIRTYFLVSLLRHIGVLGMLAYILLLGNNSLH
jgi:hypothetical protein